METGGRQDLHGSHAVESSVDLGAVAAGAAVDKLADAVSRVQEVTPIAGAHLVLPEAALETIPAASPEEPILPVPAEQPVGTGATGEPIDSVVSLENVVAAPADHPVIAVEAAGAESPGQGGSRPKAAGGGEQIVAGAPGATDPLDAPEGHLPVPVAVEGDSARAPGERVVRVAAGNLESVLAGPERSIKRFWKSPAPAPLTWMAAILSTVAT